MAVLRTMRKNKENESKIHKIERTFDSLSFIVYFLYQADNLFYRLETVLIQVIGSWHIFNCRIGIGDRFGLGRGGGR